MMKAAQVYSRLNKSARILLRVLLSAAALALPAAIASAQDIGGGGGGNPLSPSISLGGQQKRALTPEERERERQIDADYKAATSKIPAQKALDPWADVRQVPSASGQKAPAPTHNASAQKKKQPAQQPQ